MSLAMQRSYLSLTPPLFKAQLNVAGDVDISLTRAATKASSA